MPKRCREHPASLPAKAPYYLLFLLVPLFQGVFAALLAATVLVLYWVLRRRQRYYSLTPHSLRLERGLFIRQQSVIPLSCITTLTIERPLWLRSMGAARILVDTDGGTRWTADACLTVPNRHAALFLPERDGGTLYRPHPLRLWLLAVLTSDSLGGIVLLVAILRQSSILLGEGIRQTVLHNLETAAAMLTAIPRTAALLMLVLVCGWLIGAVRHLLRHLPFAVCRGIQTLTVYAGWLTRRIHCCAVSAIHYTDIRQTLTACLVRRQTVYISCTGYGKDKNTLAVILPPGKPAEIQRDLTALLPALIPTAITLRPRKGALWRYIRLPILLLALLPFGGWVAGLLFPLWGELIRYLTRMGVFPCLWWTAMGIVHRRQAGVGYAEDKITLCYARRLTLHRVTLLRQKVAALCVRQTPWQRWRGVCDVIVYSYHESRRPHRVRHLSIHELGALFPAQ